MLFEAHDSNGERHKWLCSVFMLAQAESAARYLVGALQEEEEGGTVGEGRRRRG